ncbi:MAG: flagellar biosynthesis protein FlhF, partial [Epsilonproteobacteria bacterium]
MKTFSFLGETPTIALRKAQNQCGEDAIVIYTKKISTKSRTSEDMYEILVGLDSEHQDEVKTQVIQPSVQSEHNVNTQFVDYRAEILKMQQSIEQVQKSIWVPKSQLFDLTIPP